MLDGTRKEHIEFLVTVPLLIIDDLGMRKLPLTAAEELLEIMLLTPQVGEHVIENRRSLGDGQHGSA